MSVYFKWFLCMCVCVCVGPSHYYFWTLSAAAGRCANNYFCDKWISFCFIENMFSLCSLLPPTPSLPPYLHPALLLPLCPCLCRTYHMLAGKLFQLQMCGHGDQHHSTTAPHGSFQFTCTCTALALAELYCGSSRHNLFQ